MAVHDPWIGRQLAGFKIERLLGQGGMASVYFGWDLKLQRPVAIKMIDERYRGDPAFVERFRREAQTIAAWHHPNILQIYSAGEEDGQTFFVMEYIRGRDLQQALSQYARSGLSISMAEVVRIGRAVAAALDYAHGRGVIHRDVKPSNIIVAEDGRVMLADFGLALQASGITLGQVFGSPHYISPEQARSSASVVPQSDLYSFGVILYEMLTGSVPFDDPSPTTLALQHINNPPPSPRSINPTLSPQVEMVLLKALNKLPHERYSTAHALMDALETALQTGVADSQPMTLRVLPLPGQAAPPPTRTSLPQYPPLDQTVYADLRPSLSAFPARRAPLRRFLTCFVLATGLLLLLAASVLAVFRPDMAMIFFMRTPTNIVEATVAEPAAAGTAVAQVPPTETAAPSVTTQPSETPDLPATQTAGAPPPTATVPPPLPTFTATFTPEPSATLAPSPTPLIYDLALIGREDDSIFIVNVGQIPLPVELLEFGENSRAIAGEEWEVPELQPGECLAAWSDGRNPPVPKDLECRRVGENVLRTGNRRFWIRSYDVFFNDQSIATCDTRDEPCILQFSVAQPP